MDVQVFDILDALVKSFLSSLFSGTLFGILTKKPIKDDYTFHKFYPNNNLKYSNSLSIKLTCILWYYSIIVLHILL